MNFGVDVGFHATKSVCKDRQVVFPSFTAPYTKSRISLNHSDAIAVQSDSGHFLIGDQALRLGQGARQESARWLGSPEWLSLFYASLSELTAATNFQARIVLGLPLADYDRDKRAIFEIVHGRHTFKRDGRHVQNFNVEDLRVVPQAWGAVLDELFSESGKVRNETIADQRVAILDVGGHTVNYLAVDGLADVPAESHGTNRGTWSVVRAVRDFLDLEHPDLSRHKDHVLMQAAVDRSIYDGQDKIDLAPVINPIIADIGDEIVRTARQYWGQGGGAYRQILVIGGGAYLWYTHIKKAFSHARMLEKPVMANARGFAKFAAYLGAQDE